MPRSAPAAEDVATYLAYLRFPTVSADPGSAGAMRECAGWLVDLLGGWGLRARVVDGEGPPLVVASTPATGRRRVLLYGHYDVQPPDPIEAWRHHPFDPVIEGDTVVARGATDNKGQTMAMLIGLRRALARGPLPVDVVVVIEGEEEIGSPHLGGALARLGPEVGVETLLVADTAMAEAGVPSLTLGLRGIAALDLVVEGPRADLHSGSFGGAVANPATVLARLVASLHDESGRVDVPGFYDRVVEAPALERAAWRRLPFGEDEILAASGAPSLAGEAGYTALERLWMRPTAEVNGLTAGYDGPGSKTILPRHASAKLTFRLVPHQDPGEIAALVARRLEDLAPPSVRATVALDHGGEPIVTDVNGVSARAARRAVERVAGVPPALIREGLSIPALAPLARASGGEPLLVGLGLPDCGAHSPNETFPLASLELGARVAGALLEELGAGDAPTARSAETSSSR